MSHLVRLCFIASVLVFASFAERAAAETCCDPDRPVFSDFRGAHIDMRLDAMEAIFGDKFFIRSGPASDAPQLCRNLSIDCGGTIVILERESVPCAAFGWGSNDIGARVLVMRECYFDSKGVALDDFARAIFGRYGVDPVEPVQFSGYTIGWKGITSVGEQITVSRTSDGGNVVRVDFLNMPKFD